MKEEEIDQNNKLIAEFMGYQILHKKFQYRNFNSSNESYFENDEGEIVCDERGQEVNLYPDGDPLSDLSELPFNSSWEWLMPVLEKIFRLKIGDGIEYVEYACARTFGMLNPETGQIMIRLSGSQLYQADTLIKATYMAVIDFLTWYNEERKIENNDKGRDNKGE